MNCWLSSQTMGYQQLIYSIWLLILLTDFCLDWNTWNCHNERLMGYQVVIRLEVNRKIYHIVINVVKWNITFQYCVIILDILISVCDCSSWRRRLLTTRIDCWKKHCFSTLISKNVSPSNPNWTLNNLWKSNRITASIIGHDSSSGHRRQI